MFIQTIALLDQSSLQYHLPLLVSLVILRGELVHPAQLGVAVLAEHVPHHVPPCQHHPVHHLAHLDVDHLVEEKCSACCSSEPGADQLISVTKNI